ncbi:MAG: hypothetical protein FWH26_01725 [Oscillospiraceae bacterium]|nr:hypothetical protein [Oscillospiraceae bacterium]
MKSILASKWAKIALAALLAVVIAAVSVTGTYLYMSRDRRRQEPEEITTPFTEAVANLKQQAHEAMLVPHHLERGEAIKDVGARLQGMVLDFPEELTNDIFCSDEFTVEMTEYPLSGGKTIRRFKYILTDNFNESPSMRSEFFLQYISDEESILGEIEWIYDDEASFYVFENKNGFYAFALRSYAAYDDKEQNYHVAEVFQMEDDQFLERKSAVIPFKTISWVNVELIQQDEQIRAVMNVEQRVESIFNSTGPVFELPKGNMESGPVDYDVPALLLGLSDKAGNLRTLFIRKEDGIIRSSEYAGQIIFPRQNKLYSLKAYIHEEDIVETFDDGEAYRAGSLDIKKLLYGPLGADLTASFKKMLQTPEYGHFGVSDIPLYVGPEYVCYIQNETYASGGSYHWDTDTIRFDKLTDLSRFKSVRDKNYYLIPDFKGKTLTDYVFGAGAKAFYQADTFTYAGNTNPSVDFHELAIRRNVGKWSLMLPVFGEGMHPGNGSFHRGINDFAAFSNDVPKALAANSEAMKLEGWNNWGAKDLFQFPGGDAVACQYENFLMIGNQDNNDDLCIPVRYDEYIVSINFADKDTQAKWANELKRE